MRDLLGLDISTWSRMLWRVIQVVACVSASLIPVAEKYSTAWMDGHVLFIRLSVNRHLKGVKLTF